MTIIHSMQAPIGYDYYMGPVPPDLQERMRRLQERAQSAPPESDPAPPVGLLGHTVRCRAETCQASIVWCWTENDKRMPVDAHPVETGGNIVRVGTREGAPLVRVLSQGEQTNLFDEETKPDVIARPRYMPHFATCTEAGRFHR